MKVYGVTNVIGLFSTRERAEQFLCVILLSLAADKSCEEIRLVPFDEEQGYAIEDRGTVSDEEYMQLLAKEAQCDDEGDDSILRR